MKKNRNIVRLNENQLRQMIAESVKRVLSEKKLENSFKSKEDMTRYRDMYAPYTETDIIDTDDSLYDTKTDGGGEWGSGPYMNYMGHDFGSGYDYTGDERYNEYAYDYNDRLKKRLATKGGQMSYDWDKEQRRNEDDFDNAEIEMNNLAKKRNYDKNWRPGQLRTAEKLKKGWLNGDIDDNTLGYYFNESRLRKIVSESIDRVLKKSNAVKSALTENFSNAKKPFFVSDDGGVYNAFAVDMFSNDGYLEGYNGEDGYHFDDFDKVKWFNSWEAASDFAERMNNGY